MAGIGFELQKTLERRTYTAYLQAYFTAVAYSSGPWLATLVALAVIGAVARPVLGVRAVNEFTAVLVYVYAGSLLLAGPVQLVLTRYVADCLFKEDPGGILSGVGDALALVSGLALGAAYLFGVVSDLPFPILVAGGFLLVVIACLWVVMAYLTCVKRFQAVTSVFLLGTLASVLLSVGLAIQAGMGTLGLLVGFGLGHAAMLAALIWVSSFDLEFQRRGPGSFFAYFGTLWDLALAGFLLNLALWADKFVVWGITRVEEVPGLYSNWQYDIPAYLAYLSVLPSQAFFLIKVEVQFEARYQAFLKAVSESPAETVIRRKDEMNEALRDGLAQLFKFQGVISLVVLLLASDLLIALRLHTVPLALFQVMLFGAYCHFGLLQVLVFVMYLDRRRELVRILGVFVFLSLGGTAFGVLASPEPSPLWAAGYALASAACLVWAIRVVLGISERIDYLLLFKQELRDAEQRVIQFVPSTDR